MLRRMLVSAITASAPAHQQQLVRPGCARCCLPAVVLVSAVSSSWPVQHLASLQLDLLQSPALQPANKTQLCLRCMQAKPSAGSQPRKGTPGLLWRLHGGIVAACTRLELEALWGLAVAPLLAVAGCRSGLLGALLPELLP